MPYHYTALNAVSNISRIINILNEEVDECYQFNILKVMEFAAEPIIRSCRKYSNKIVD